MRCADFEARGNTVLYVTSQIETHDDLTQAYASNTVVEQAAALFAPGEIQLPDRKKQHWLCFRPGDPWAYLYSDEGRRFRRKYPEIGLVSWKEI